MLRIALLSAASLVLTSCHFISGGEEFDTHFLVGDWTGTYSELGSSIDLTMSILGDGSGTMALVLVDSDEIYYDVDYDAEWQEVDTDTYSIDADCTDTIDCTSVDESIRQQALKAGSQICVNNPGSCSIFKLILTCTAKEDGYALACHFIVPDAVIDGEVRFDRVVTE